MPGYSHLLDEERDQIAALKAAGRSIGAIARDRRLRDFVCDRLAEGWTPEQIAGWLKAGHERGLRALGFEAIYAFVDRAARKGEDLWRSLTRRHKRRRPRRARPSRDRIKDRASIHDRPRDVEGRAEIGHWEGDLIICKRTRPVLVLHERKSRVTLATRQTRTTTVLHDVSWLQERHDWPGLN